MKIRSGFVSNSSSSSFIIYNTSKEGKNIVDFVKENAYLIDEFKSGYGYEDDESICLKTCLLEANDEYYEYLEPGEELSISFGDDDGTILGRVYDYILRDGGKSENFEWYLTGMNR